MSLFDDNFAAVGVSLLMHYLGEEIVYKPAAGGLIPLTADVGEEQIEEVETDNGRRLRRTRTVKITTDPTSEYGGVTSPKLNDAATIRNGSWAVERIVSLTASMATLELVRTGDIERSQEGYRRRGRA